MVYWVQRKRYWTMKRLCRDFVSGQRSPVPTVSQALESKLRKRAFRLGRPGLLERMQYGLDQDGFADPNPMPPDPAMLRLHEKLFAGRWWEKN